MDYSENRLAKSEGIPPLATSAVPLFHYTVTNWAIPVRRFHSGAYPEGRALFIHAWVWLGTVASGGGGIRHM